MCGIAGEWSQDGGVDPARVVSMLDASRHRGPDGRGLWAHARVALGHARLAIHDLTPAGAQPLTSRDKNLVVVVNGTFHNAPELRAAEVARGYRFASRSDSEVLIPLYERLGRDLLPELRGPFALAILDRRAGSLFLARDRLGQKPLFVHRSGRGLLFASELRALLATRPDASWRPDRAAAFLQAGYVPRHETVFDGISSLPPGSFLEADGAGVRTARWWTPPRAETVTPATDATSLLEDSLAESVRLRTRTERPLGVLLSGGLDSAAMLLLATRARGTPVRSFTLGFGSRHHDERSAARETARALQSPHASFEFDAEPGPLVRELVEDTGELLADSSWLALALLCRKIRGHATVLLAGDGGDELLLGYRRHTLAALATRLRPPFFRRALAAAAPALPGVRLSRAVASLAEGPAAVLADLVGLAPRRELRDLLDPSVFPEADPLSAWYADLSPPTDGGEAAGWLDLQTYLAGDLLAKADRAAMASGLEIWSPFLDPHVVEALMRLPADVRLRANRGKAPLRSLLAPHLPPRALRRKKRGFGVPLVRWLRHGAYGDFAREVLGDTTPLFSGLLRDGDPLRLLRRMREGEDDLAPLVHACVTLALFAQTFAPSYARRS